MPKKPAAYFAIAAILACTFFITSQAQAAVQRQGIEGLSIEGQYAVSAAIGHDLPGYHVRMDGRGLAADNACNSITAWFTGGGVEIGSGMQRFSLRPVAWGYGDELTALQPGVPQAVGNMVTARRGAVSEWYVNSPLGLQQGFTITEPPQAGSGVLRIDMAIDGAFAGRVDEDGRGVMLTGTDGTALYRYSGLVVRDAAGREAEAWLETREGLMRICVNDAGIGYPLYIDPIIQMAKLTASDGAASDYFGTSVAISGDTVVVGARDATVSGHFQQGSAYVFVEPAGGWSTTSSYTAKLTASDGAAGDSFGISVAISGDTVVVGAFWAQIDGNTNQGAAYVFVKPAGGWATTSTYAAKLTASDGTLNDNFGWSVAISGDTVVVGSPNAAIGGHTNQGSAYVFVEPAGGWSTTSSYTAKLTASDGAAGDLFGWSVAISGDTVVVGAPHAAIGGQTRQGAAYVFVKPAGVWATTSIYAAKLTASDGTLNDNFGWSVAISGDTVVVGSSNALIGGHTNQGAAYVFVKPAGVWATTSIYAAKLTASDGAAKDFFGFSVAINSDTVVVGAFKAVISGNIAQGASYVFKYAADEPIFQATNAVFANLAANSMTVSWTPGTGTDSIVLMKLGSAVDADPADGIDYTANTAFGSGAQIGTGNYVVYSGSGDTVTVTGLSPATTYYVAVYDYSVSPPSEAANYRQTRPATGSQSTSSALTAVADSYTTPQNTNLVVAAPGVLTNDTGIGLTAIPVSNPAHGTLSLAADGSFVYMPIHGYTGSDSFTYKVSDGVAESASVTVTIAVTSHDITAAADSYTTGFNTQLVQAVPGVLANDTGTGLTAILVTNPAHGSFALSADGSFIYIPDNGYTGTDSFTYKISDGTAESEPATVTITIGKQCPMVKLYGEDSAQVELLRRYRDEVLEQTATGGLVASLYYKLAPLAEKMIDNSPYLRQTAKRLVDMLLPAIKRRLER